MKNVWKALAFVPTLCTLLHKKERTLSPQDMSCCCFRMKFATSNTHVEERFPVSQFTINNSDTRHNFDHYIHCSSTSK